MSIQKPKDQRQQQQQQRKKAESWYIHINATECHIVLNEKFRIHSAEHSERDTHKKE